MQVTIFNYKWEIWYLCVLLGVLYLPYDHHTLTMTGMLLFSFFSFFFSGFLAVHCTSQYVWYNDWCNTDLMPAHEIESGSLNDNFLLLLFISFKCFFWYTEIKRIITWRKIANPISFWQGWRNIYKETLSIIKFCQNSGFAKMKILELLIMNPMIVIYLWEKIFIHTHLSTFCPYALSALRLTNFNDLCLYFLFLKSRQNIVSISL